MSRLLTMRETRASASMRPKAFIGGLVLTIFIISGCEQREYHIATFDSLHLAHEAAAMLNYAGVSQVTVKSDQQRASATLFTTEPYVRFARGMLNETTALNSTSDVLMWNDDVSHSIESSTLLPTRREEAAKFWHVWRERALASLRDRLSTQDKGVLEGLSIRGTRLHIQLHETGNADVRMEFQTGDDASTLTSISQPAQEAISHLLKEIAKSSQTRFRLDHVEVRLVPPSPPAPTMVKVQRELELAKTEQPYVFSGRPAWQYQSVEIVVWSMIVAGLTLIGLYLQGKFRFTLASKR